MPEFPNTSYFQTAFASYFAWFPSNTCNSNLYLLYRCIMRGNIFFYLHENVLDPKFINRYQGTSHQKHQWKEIFEPPKSITFSWPGKWFFFIAEIKETGIHCEISSPILVHLLSSPRQKKLDKRGAISIQQNQKYQIYVNIHTWYQPFIFQRHSICFTDNGPKKNNPPSYCSPSKQIWLFIIFDILFENLKKAN